MKLNKRTFLKSMLTIIVLSFMSINVFALDVTPEVQELKNNELEVLSGVPVDKINPEDFEKLQVIVNKKPVAAAPAYLNENGEIMLPLRSIAEALNYEVIWERETHKIMIGTVSSLQIGVDSYTFARMAPITLGTAPELKNDITYVPAKYFTDVLKIEFDISQGNFSFTKPQ